MNPDQILASLDFKDNFRVNLGLSQRSINAGGNHVVPSSANLWLMEGLK
jgi:hypothetical protein